MRGEVADQRTLRQKMAAMVERGTPAEAAIARAWLEHRPTRVLSAEQILTADDSAFGPSEAEVEAAYQAFMKRSNNAG